MSRSLFFSTMLFPFLAGCGTIANLNAPPTSSGYRAFGPTGCEPFGGVQKSFIIGGVSLMGGPFVWPFSVAALGIDAPLSLVGDVVTYPIARARQQRRPWATSWGQQEKASNQMGDPAPSANSEEFQVSLPATGSPK